MYVVIEKKKACKNKGAFGGNTNKCLFYIVHNYIKKKSMPFTKMSQIAIELHIAGFFLVEWIIFTREKICSYFMHGKQSIFPEVFTSDSKIISIHFRGLLSCIDLYLLKISGLLH